MKKIEMYAQRFNRRNKMIHTRILPSDTSIQEAIATYYKWSRHHEIVVVIDGKIDEHGLIGFGIEDTPEGIRARYDKHIKKL